MDHKEEHPVLVIATAAHCGYCDSMRGMSQVDREGNVIQGSLGKGNGWPSSKNPMLIPPKRNARWDSAFFKSLLTAGKNDGVQRVEVFEVHYNMVFQMEPENLTEFSIFSLNKAGNLLVRKFKRPVDKTTGMSHATFLEGMDPSEVKWNTDSKDFSEYRDSWIASKDIAAFQTMYPNMMYFSSTIWYSAILNKTSLYGYFPASKVVYQPHDHLKYMISRGSYKESEDRLDPIETCQMLLKDLSILHYPPEHGKIYMTIRN